MSYKTDFNIFVGCTLGTFRGINFHRKQNDWKTLIKSIQNLKCLDENCEITEMAWSDSDEIDILIGMKNQQVKIYDTDYKGFTSSVSVKFGEGKICGLSKFNGLLLTAVESGDIRLWRFKSQEGDILNVGGEIQKMRHNTSNKNIIAVGGKGKMDLKLWDLETKKYVFIARNVRPNELQLQVPVWISDIGFLSNSDAIAVCTRYGQIRLYDPKVQRRPVVNIELPDETLTTMCLTGRENCIMVGSGRGTMKLVDLRGKRSVVKSYKGSVGSIRSIACTPNEPFVVSVGLDRFIKVHNIHTAELLHKEYLKTQLNCVLIRSQFTVPKEKPDEILNDSVIEVPCDGDDIQIITECDSIFEGMETIVEPVRKRRKELVDSESLLSL